MGLWTKECWIACCCLSPLIIAYYLYWERFLKFPIVFVNLFHTGLEIRAHLSGRREFVFNNSKAKIEFLSRICYCYLAGKVGKSFWLARVLQSFRILSDIIHLGLWNVKAEQVFTCTGCLHLPCAQTGDHHQVPSSIVLWLLLWGSARLAYSVLSHIDGGSQLYTGPHPAMYSLDLNFMVGQGALIAEPFLQYLLLSNTI